MAGKRSLIGRFLRLSWRRRLLLVEAAAWLAIARLAILLLPFRWLTPHFGRTMAESPASDPRAADVGRWVAWAVGIASRTTPWHNKCLGEAIAGKAMLRRRGVASTLYLGLAKADSGDLEAHAWLRCGSRILTGGGLSEGYTVVAKFAERP